MKNKVLLAGILSFLCLQINAQNVVEDYYVDNKGIVVIFGIFILTCLVCYIIAKVKSKRGQLVLTANGGDKALLIITAVCLFIAALFGNELPDSFTQVLYIAAGICFCWSIYFSISHNLDNIGHILISCLAKIFIIWLFVMTLFILLIILIVSIVISMTNRNDKDGEYILLKYDRSLNAFIGYRYRE